ncbi:GTP-binding protein rho1 [Coccidioides immitis RMSCC 3703]|uniref:GTP-binding protein rho1 n=1 Tax=Coccidioides immitis RMSCC 3703 TaxID=454286 RepID=A0A0J8RBM2_COCIT|nr:GTP-binding protein rho1 [Coccidioides immitis RMSCC 3703]
MQIGGSPGVGTNSVAAPVPKRPVAMAASWGKHNVRSRLRGTTTYGGHIRRHSSVVNEKGPSSLSPRRKPVRSQRQEEYDRLRPLSYPETDLLFVCFAIDCPVSLENVMDKWYPEVLHFCPTTPLILVGLKSDLRTKRTCIELLKSQGLTPVTPEQGQAVAQRMGALYVECSSKEMRGVDEVFELAVNTAVGIQESSWNSHGGGHQGGGGKKIKKRSCKIL